MIILGQEKMLRRCCQNKSNFSDPFKTNMKSCNLIFEICTKAELQLIIICISVSSV